MLMHTLRNAALALVGVLLIAVGVAQTDDSSKIQAARAATEPVFELGRYLSDI